ncbi:MAG: site-specific integrase [Bacteroidetes bacterium]|nr:site-specific integrase [Bacteroidota bacterium]
MSFTTKLILDKRRQKQDGTYSLRLRIFKNSKYTEVSLGVSILEVFWDAQSQKVKNTHPHFKLLNSKIATQNLKMQERILLLEKSDKVYSLSEVAGTTKKAEKVTFNEFGKQVVENYTKSGKIGSAIAYQTAINKITSYCLHEIHFEAMDYTFLKKVEQCMSQEGMKINAIASYMRQIRAIYNQAIKSDLVEEKFYPFKKYKLKTEKTLNKTLDIQTLKDIYHLKLVCKSNEWHYRTYFLLSFSLRGISFIDMLLLTGKNYKNGNLYFKRRKTGKVYTIKLHPFAKTLLEYYCDLDAISAEDYLLPDITSKEAVAIKKQSLQVVKMANKYLSKIGLMVKSKDKITTYYERYTWANVAKCLGYSKDIIAEALGHEYGNAVTGIYLDNYNNDIIDEMNDKVIGSLLK